MRLPPVDCFQNSFAGTAIHVPAKWKTVLAIELEILLILIVLVLLVVVLILVVHDVPPVQLRCVE